MVGARGVSAYSERSNNFSIFVVKGQTATKDDFSVPCNRLSVLAKRHKLEIEKSSTSPVELLAKHIWRYDESDLSRLFWKSASLLESAYRSGVDPDSDVRHVLGTQWLRHAAAISVLSGTVDESSMAETRSTGKRVITTVPQSFNAISKLPPRYRSLSRIPLTSRSEMLSRMSSGIPLPLSSTCTAR
jgi:hypothetical protein